MRADDRLIVGLISGTSLDGVDAALVHVSGDARTPQVQLMAFLTWPYPRKIRARLLAVAGGQPMPGGEISELNFLVGECFGRAVLEVCGKGGIRSESLQAIGSHGQTIFHRGKSKGGTCSTLQIGEAAVIAEWTGAPVVSDFRTADLAARGQGAPLVPLLDYLLLAEPERATVALNIGGIANVTVVPAGASREQVFGFDTGPGNMVIDGLVRHASRGRRQYDAEGSGAARGRVIEPLLEAALGLPFFGERPPKSAGREEFGQEFLDQYFLKVGNRLENLLRTATELTARSIAGALRRFVLPKTAARKPDSGSPRSPALLVVSGGGAHNLLLITRICELLPEMEIHRSDDFGLPVDAKEAIAFALLADHTLHGLAGNLPSVTGARRAVVLGKISRPGQKSVAHYKGRLRLNTDQHGRH